MKIIIIEEKEDCILIKKKDVNIIRRAIANILLVGGYQVKVIIAQRQAPLSPYGLIKNQR